jgi:hypothetical protein
MQQEWWYRPIIPAFRRLKQKAWKFKVNLNYIARSCPKQKTKREGREGLAA